MNHADDIFEPLIKVACLCTITAISTLAIMLPLSWYLSKPSTVIYRREDGTLLEEWENDQLYNYIHYRYSN